jgi:hypothetical protein
MHQRTCSAAHATDISIPRTVVYVPMLGGGKHLIMFVIFRDGPTLHAVQPHACAINSGGVGWPGQTGMSCIHAQCLLQCAANNECSSTATGTPECMWWLSRMVGRVRHTGCGLLRVHTWCSWAEEQDTGFCIACELAATPFLGQVVSDLGCSTVGTKGVCTTEEMYPMMGSTIVWVLWIFW